MNAKGEKGRILAILLLLLVAAGLMLAASAYYLSRPYKGFSGSETFVWVPKGSSVPEIGRLLHRSGVVRSPQLFTWYVRLLHPTSSLKAGEYRFDRAVSMREAADKLLKGEVYVVKVTVREGLSRQEIIDLLVSQDIAGEQSLENASRDTSLIADLDSAATDLEGYLYPDTFFFSRRITGEEAIRTMVAGFLQIWTPERQQRARELNMGLREVLTLASIIEKETGQADERPLVSAVFHNRLKKNIPLGSDPTVIYAVKQVMEYDGIIHQSDLKLESPYNTYLNTGLPPGPIANPGLASIDAALNPAEVDFLYFVSRNDGSHLFSVDYSDHVRAVNKYQR